MKGNSRKHPRIVQNAAFRTGTTISCNQETALEASLAVFYFQQCTSVQFLNSDDLIRPVQRVLLSPRSLVNRKIQGSVQLRDLEGRKIPLGV